MRWKNRLEKLLDTWPSPYRDHDVSTTFAAMREVLANLADQHLSSEGDRERVKNLARGHIRQATRLAVEAGVPAKAIFSPFMLLLSRHNLER